MVELNINGRAHKVDVEEDTPLLWVLREQAGLTGTKYGCGIAACGACTVHIDGQPTRSCSFPVAAAVGKKITTIEGLSPDSTHKVQKAWVQLDVPQCGACTVHVDGQAVRSCSMAVSDAAGKKITTIEGLAVNGKLTKVQQAWVDNDVPQCGYCQCGMIMAVSALLAEKPKPTDKDIDEAITNICRCGTFQQVREAIHAAANA